MTAMTLQVFDIVCHLHRTGKVHEFKGNELVWTAAKAMPNKRSSEWARIQPESSFKMGSGAET